MARAVQDVLDVGRERSPAQIEERTRDVDIRSWVAAADVINISRYAIFENGENAARMIVHEKPIAYLGTVSINRHGFIVEQVRHEKWDEFFRKLVRAIRVRPSRDQDWKIVGGVISEDLKIAPALLAEYGDRGTTGSFSNDSPCATSP